MGTFECGRGGSAHWEATLVEHCENISRCLSDAAYVAVVKVAVATCLAVCFAVNTLLFVMWLYKCLVATITLFLTQPRSVYSLLACHLIASCIKTHLMVGDAGEPLIWMIQSTIAALSHMHYTYPSRPVPLHPVPVLI